ncbi:transcription initiation factor TFIID subunit A-domain-containing protein [Phyllosticta citribraziliensis]|uniref:Transcription initiation factor TFIID subunit A-domain-containing protein n=1 Tax=Phyllosticta citribraziliensis TaxID=989973 RepID=A0ABR1LCN4_9PEZI
MSGNVPQQGPSGPTQNRPLPPGIRVNQIQTLPHLSDAQKATYTRGVANLYDTISRSDKDSTDYKAAVTKLFEFTKRMGKEVNEWKAKNQPGAAQQQGDRPPSQGGQPQGQPPQQPNQQPPQQQPSQQPPPPPQQQAPQQAPQQAQGHPAPQPNQPQGARPQIPPKILQHVQSFPIQLPSGMPHGTPEADNKIKELRQTYLQMLARQEQVASSIKRMQQISENPNRQDLPANFEAQKNQLQAQYQTLERNVQEFRNQQNNWRNMAQQQGSPQQQVPQGGQAHQGAQNQPNQPGPQRQTPQQQPPPPQQTPVPQVKPEPNTQPSQQQHAQPPHPQAQQTQAPGQANQAQQQAQQHQTMQGPGPQMANNAAMEAARQQQMNANRPSMSPATSGPQQQGQTQPTFAQGGNMTPGQQVPGQIPQQPQQQQQQQQQSMNPQRPPLNPQQASQMNQMHQGSPHPQSAGGPMPLTHGQAMGAAARTHSEARVTPQIQQPNNQSYPMGNRAGSEQMTNPKMPIPKNLPPQPPHPVNMGPARPTMGGPSNGAPGMLGQPVVSAHPQFHLEGDESRVLSKKKLDELVRQVTGAGELPTGETLGPEVEEAMLQLADDFLDNVVTSACKLAKLRESSQLEIRDIQCVLERNYNIRIPGYASDEIRTVRKFQPAPGWTQKMNAVQAAKVMGGKTD